MSSNSSGPRKKLNLKMPDEMGEDIMYQVLDSKKPLYRRIMPTVRHWLRVITNPSIRFRVLKSIRQKIGKILG